MAIKPPRAPRTVEQATDLLEQIARLDGEAATIAANRDSAIASTNAIADALVVPVLEERSAIAGVVEAWWVQSGHTLLTGRRKTIQLGGCDIGSKKAPTALTFTNDDFEAAVTALRAERWAKPYVRITYSVAKKDTTAALDGKHGDQLRALGFGKRGGADVFVLSTVTQTGTIGS